MGKIEEIKKEIDNIDNMIKHLRQSTDGLWNYINDHINTTISMMMEIVEWAQQIVNSGIEFPINTVVQQIQNMNESYTAKDEVLLADTLEYEIKNTFYVYMENN
ncbi:hypothetical protein [Agathobacter sp.]|uniref:hypothetical protein n=1 Tax=Agathobacter sp. TaxID=2021311 RepID=UPI003AB780C2